MDRKIIDLTEEVSKRKKSEFEEQLDSSPDLQYKKYVDSIRSISSITEEVSSKKQYSEKLLNQINKISSSVLENVEEQDKLLKKIEDIFYTHTTEEEYKNNQLTKGFVASIVDKFTEEEKEQIFKDFDINKKFKEENINDFITFLLETKDINKLLKDSQDELDAINKEFNDKIDDVISELDSFKYMEELKEKIDSTTDEDEKLKLQTKLNDLYGVTDLSIISNKIKNKGFKQLLKEANKNKNKNIVEITRKALKKLNSDPNHMYPSQKMITKIFRCLILLFKDNDKAKVITYVFFKHISNLKNISNNDARFIIFFVIYTLKISFFEENERKDSYFYNKLKEMVDSIDVSK